MHTVDEMSGPWTPPSKRALSGLVVRNDMTSVLLIKPTYRSMWTVPGGLVDTGESPFAACAREARQDLGMPWQVGRLLCVDWVPPRPDLVDGLMFLFDGGRLRGERVSQIRLNPSSVEDYRFVSAPDLDGLVVPGLATRLRVALHAQARGSTAYLDDGVDSVLPS